MAELAALVRGGRTVVDVVLAYTTVLRVLALAKAVVLVAAEAQAVAKDAAAVLMRVAKHVLVDGLRADVLPGLERETAADLFGAPALSKFGFHKLLQLALNLASGHALRDATPACVSVGLERVVVDLALVVRAEALDAVASELAGDGRPVAPEPPGDLGRRQILSRQRRNLIPLVESQLLVAHRPLFLVVEERRSRRRLIPLFVHSRLHGVRGRPAPARLPPQVVTRRTTNVPSSPRRTFAPVLHFSPELDARGGPRVPACRARARRCRRPR